jgi:hypothetical protein
VNSAKVAGGIAVLPEHSIFPVPQSPVTHEKLEPVESWEQSVRPQKRPPQEVGAVMVLDSSFWRAKPVVESVATPAFERIPGHTVYSHMFTTVKVVEINPVIEKKSTLLKFDVAGNFNVNS